MIQSATKTRTNTGQGGFTSVELLVVLGIIVLLLTVGLPAFNQMSRQADRTRARSIISAALQRAQVLAISSRAPTAVRFVPAAWEEASEGVNAIRGPQAVAIYQFRFTANDPLLGSTEFNQRFEMVNNVPPQTLPGDLWVAPAEALLHDPVDNSGFFGRRILGDDDGTDPGDFDTDADAANENHFDADDFLIVFEPETGVQAARWSTVGGQRRTPWQIDGYDPRSLARSAWEIRPDGTLQTPRRPYRRFNFTGLVMYEREVFIERHQGSSAADRQAFLQQEGEVFHVDRNGGSLIPVSEAKQK